MITDIINEELPNYKKYLLDLFCELVKFDTTAKEDSNIFPSTISQIEFAKILGKKCEEIGLEDIEVDKYGYVNASLKAFGINKDNAKKIGFIAHMDTSPDYNGNNICPIITYNYEGLDIKLKNNITISRKKFKSLDKYIGKTIITADGNTLLGVDDKAGIVEILTAFKFIKESAISHNDIKLCFTPDEEVGDGTKYFDVNKFACDFAYTIDGSGIGDFNYENFNASTACVHINGVNIHAGYATDTMENAGLIANEFINLMPNKTPTNTKDYEGFFHITTLNANVDHSIIMIEIRDFDKKKFEEKKEILKQITSKLNKKYTNGVRIVIKDSYKNMAQVLENKKEVIQTAINAMKISSVVPKTAPIRGGTDGARLSFMGLACPNIFTGGHNAHGPYEYVCLESMLKACEVIINIASK